MIDLYLFLCFRDDLEYYYIPVPHETFIKYDQIIINNVELISFELILL
jgi:hypothetical protein